MDTHQIAAWLAAHPLEALMALGVVLNLVNGLLPSRVRSGPVGRAVHVLLDRVSVLTRADAPGTLKWPLVVGSILRAGADAIDPPMPPRAAERGHARPGAMLAVVVLLWAGLAVELQGCPRLPPPDGCAPAAWRCAGARPERCSPGRRWTPVGDLPCGATGLVCVELAARARCAAGGAR